MPNLITAGCDGQATYRERILTTIESGFGFGF